MHLQIVVLVKSSLISLKSKIEFSWLLKLSNVKCGRIAPVEDKSLAWNLGKYFDSVIFSLNVLNTYNEFCSDDLPDITWPV